MKSPSKNDPAVKMGDTPHRGDTPRNDTPSMAFSGYTPHRGDTFGTVKRAETERLFFAVRVPEVHHSLLLNFQKQLWGDWKAVPPEQFHITVVFMAHVLPSEMTIVESAATLVTQSRKSFSIRLASIGCFPDQRRPRVLVVHAESPELAKTALDLRDALGDVEHDNKPFKGHLTLARAKGPRLRIPETSLNLDWRVDQLELIQSRLLANGAEHTVLKTFAFSSS